MCFQQFWDNNDALWQRNQIYQAPDTYNTCLWTECTLGFGLFMGFVDNNDQNLSDKISSSFSFDIVLESKVASSWSINTWSSYSNRKCRMDAGTCMVEELYNSCSYITGFKYLQTE